MMTIVLNCKGFKLPRIERGKFVDLMHLGLDYDRNTQLFSIKNYDNIEKVIDAVTGILGDKVAFLQHCIQCGKDFACRGCNYIDVCTTKNLPFSCVCPQCLRDRTQENITKG
jgi:hypothetical protein